MRRDGAKIFAASETHLLAAPEDRLDAARLAEFFAFAEPSGESTFFATVRPLRPGDILVVRPEGIAWRALPQPRCASRVDDASWEVAVEELAARLDAAVLRSLEGHRRVAVWLSGGLDSAPIAALAARHLGPDAVEAIAWRLRDPAADDEAYVVETARALGIRLHWIDCDEALPFSDLETWPVHPSTPEQTPYRRFHELSYRRAAELGAGLVLNGFGGDQLYIAPRRWFWTLLAAAGPGRAVDRLREAARSEGWRRVVRSQVLAPLLPKARGLRRPPPGYLTEEAREILAGRAIWPADAHRARRPSQAVRLLSLADAGGYAQERWYAARHGLDVRSPMRDRPLVEWMLALPDHFLRQGTETRPALRAAMRDLVPEAVRRRTTKGSFTATLDHGLSPTALPWAPKLLLAPDALWRPHVQEDFVRRWLSGDLRDEWDRLGFIQCLNAELWRFKRAGGELASLAAEH